MVAMMQAIGVLASSSRRRQLSCFDVAVLPA
jgi:hypothetical protein